MLRHHLIRTDVQRHHEELAVPCRREEDAVNIERAFAALLVLANELDVEQRRAMREELLAELPTQQLARLTSRHLPTPESQTSRIQRTSVLTLTAISTATSTVPTAGISLQRG